MRFAMRALGALLASVLSIGLLHAQQATPAGEFDKISYVRGLDAGSSIGPGLPDIDMPALQRALENAMAGGKPLLPAADAGPTLRAMMANIVARKAGKPAQPVDRVKVALLVGADLARGVQDMQGSLVMPMFLRGVQDGANPQATPALSAEAIAQARSDWSARMAAARATQRAAAGQEAQRKEQAFLDANRQVKGVFVTPSGLQYSVLRQGTGVRPRPGQRVRVHYVGKLLDGTTFDSSYARGEPAVFGLDQVIKGWSEGVGMMPVGAQYRFWIPAALGYGEKGAGADIPPNATLMFDVELLGVE